MSSLFASVSRFADAMKEWYPYAARRPAALYPNHPAPGNPNFCPSIPPNPVPRLGINITTAGSIIVAIEEYQATVRDVRPTAWPSMPYDERQISDIKFHMAAILQTLTVIIPDHLHEVPGPLKETMDCLAQSLMRFETISPDIRGKWRTFNHVEANTSSNTFQEILNLTNMKLRQLRDKAIGETFSSPVIDREEQSVAAMIIESPPRQNRGTTNGVSKSLWKTSLLGISINLNIFGHRKQPVAQEAPRLQPSRASTPVLLQTERPTVRQHNQWEGPHPTPQASETLSVASGPFSYRETTTLPVDIPGLLIDSPETQSYAIDIPYSPVSKHATICPIPIGSPSSSPTHVAIREAAVEYRRKRAAEQACQAKERRKAINRAWIARRAARRAGMNFASVASIPISGTAAAAETQHIENVGQLAEACPFRPPNNMFEFRPPGIRVHFAEFDDTTTRRARNTGAQGTRVRPARIRPAGSDDENVPTAPRVPWGLPAVRTRPSLAGDGFAKQVIPRTVGNPVSLFSLGA
ncbi:hypothetical protein TWF481_011718 [Arthrobotrys musiformis]|uniref:Uncharacterized protein n=1 Tax=Arthrobotrys musiformis TaxID=47236 RepID=A0AAV9VZD4_9PEZI